MTGGSDRLRSADAHAARSRGGLHRGPRAGRGRRDVVRASRLPMQPGTADPKTDLDADAAQGGPPAATAWRSSTTLPLRCRGAANWTLPADQVVTTPAGTTGPRRGAHGRAMARICPTRTARRDPRCMDMELTKEIRLPSGPPRPAAGGIARWGCPAASASPRSPWKRRRCRCASAATRRAMPSSSRASRSSRCDCRTSPASPSPTR